MYTKIKLKINYLQYNKIQRIIKSTIRLNINNKKNLSKILYRYVHKSMRKKFANKITQENHSMLTILIIIILFSCADWLIVF